MVRFITAYPEMYYTIFLVIDGRTAYLVSYREDRATFDDICPCCTWPHHRKAIMDAINDAREKELFDGKVIWAHTNDKWKRDLSQMGEKYSPLDSDTFKVGYARDIPDDLAFEVMRQTKAHRRGNL